MSVGKYESDSMWDSTLTFHPPGGTLGTDFLRLSCLQWWQLNLISSIFLRNIIFLIQSVTQLFSSSYIQNVISILVKNRAWSPSLPFPSLRSVTFFTSTEVPLFFRQVGKCYIWLQPYRWGLRFGTYLGWNFRFGLRYRGQNVSKLLVFLHKFRSVFYINFYINWGTTFFNK